MKRAFSMPRLAKLLGAGFLLALSAHAQAPDASQNELIQQLLRRIDQLESRVTELEGQRGPARPPVATTPLVSQAPPPPAPAPAAAATHDHGTPLNEAITATTFPN